jgi:hypothetical protein
MGCVVAIVQGFYGVDNVDSLMSRSDLLCIAHVGGILKSSRQRFYSDMFNIFDIVDDNIKLGRLIKAKLPMLISPTPRQPRRLTSASKWRTFFYSKLPNPKKENQATRSLKEEFSERGDSLVSKAG